MSDSSSDEEAMKDSSVPKNSEANSGNAVHEAKEMSFFELASFLID